MSYKTINAKLSVTVENYQLALICCYVSLTRIQE